MSLLKSLCSSCIRSDHVECFSVSLPSQKLSVVIFPLIEAVQNDKNLETGGRKSESRFLSKPDRTAAVFSSDGSSSSMSLPRNSRSMSWDALRPGDVYVSCSYCLQDESLDSHSLRRIRSTADRCAPGCGFFSSQVLNCWCMFSSTNSATWLAWPKAGIV